MSVTLVLTEHAGALTPETLEQYRLLRERVEAAAGTAVDAVAYEELTSLAGADAVVLSGSFAPWAEHEPEALERLGAHVRAYEGPVLGICAGMQLQALFAGGSVRHAAAGPSHGFATVDVVEDDVLFRGLPRRVAVFEHHTDEIERVPDGFRVLARSDTCAVEALADPARRWWGTQFHPESWDAAHPAGEAILRNFFRAALS